MIHTERSRSIHPEKLRIILASKSPRRKELLERLKVTFTVAPNNVKESYPDGLGCKDTAVFLSRKKAEAYGVINGETTLLIACDTLVCLKGKILGKPACYNDAVEMLVQLSGNMHEVITAVTLRSSKKTKSFYVSSKVYFKSLKIDDIKEYVRNWMPYDKAGGYGIQECYSEKGELLSPVAIERIEGSYSNIMGLPLEELKVQLQLFTGG